MWFALLLALAIPSDSTAVAVAPAESLSVSISGSGAPVVLIPAILSSAYAYRRVVPLLNDAGYRTFIIEPLGVGGSGRPRGADYSFAAQAERLAAALDSLGVSDAIVVAHSTSAAIAFRLAVHRSDLVRAIVSLEGGPAERATTDGFRHAMKLAPLIRLFGGMRLIRGKVKAGMIAATSDPSWVTDSIVRGYTAAAGRDVGAALRAYRSMAESVEPDSLAPQLGEIRCPVRLVIGGVPHTGGPSPDEVALLADRLAAFTADTLPGIGHFPNEEDPGTVATAVHEVDVAAAYARLFALQ